MLTDFGEDDFFVASLKGVILTINPSARIVDITHQVPDFDIRAAGCILLFSYRYFPKKTIFLTVVDPGVGSPRKILLAETRDFFFIAPDNGVLSPVLEREEVRQMREVANSKYFLPELSSTFEGRDKMAPAAAWLSRGISCQEFGPEALSYEKLEMGRPKLEGNQVIGHVVYLDKFGNILTDIPRIMLDQLRGKKDQIGFTLSIKGRTIPSIQRSYSAAQKGELLALVGSVGFIEIAAREKSASDILKARVGDEVRVQVSDGLF